MGILRVLGIIILVLLLISLIRIGGTAEYGEAGILVRARLGFIRFTVYPRKKKAKKKPAKKKEAGAGAVRARGDAALQTGRAVQHREGVSAPGGRRGRAV